MIANQGSEALVNQTSLMQRPVYPPSKNVAFFDARQEIYELLAIARNNRPARPETAVNEIDSSMFERKSNDPRQPPPEKYQMKCRALSHARRVAMQRPTKKKAYPEPSPDIADSNDDTKCTILPRATGVENI